MAHQVIRHNHPPVVLQEPGKLVTKADVAPTPKADSVGDDYKFNLSAAANDRHDILELKWTLNKESMLPPGIRLTDRASDRDVDLRHQLDALRRGFDAALVTVGRKREGRVDSGEKVIESHDVALEASCFNLLEQNGFVLLDVRAERKAPEGKFGKEKFILICTFGRDDGELTPFEPTVSLMRGVHDVVQKTFQFLHAWANPNGTMTWNFVGRSDKAPSKMVTVNDGKLGVYQS